MPSKRVGRQPEHASSQQGAILWERGAVCCSCLSLARDRIEITLIVAGVVFERQLFRDSAAASAFAVEKMRAHSSV